MQTTVLPHDAAMYVWEWGSGFIATLLGVLFNVDVRIYTPHPRDDCSKEVRDMLAKIHKAYLESPNDVGIRSMLLRRSSWLVDDKPESLPKDFAKGLCTELKRTGWGFVKLMLFSITFKRSENNI